MYELFATIDKFVWIADTLVFAVFFVLLIKEEKVSSTVIALGVIVLVDGVMLNYVALLESNTNEEYINLVRFAWYIGFALIDGFVIYSVYKLHLISSTPYSFIAKLTFLEYFTYGVMQVVRYVERAIFHTDELESLYQFGILAINIATTAVVIIFAIIVCYQKYRISKDGEVWLWSY